MKFKEGQMVVAIAQYHSRNFKPLKLGGVYTVDSSRNGVMFTLKEREAKGNINRIYFREDFVTMDEWIEADREVKVLLREEKEQAIATYLRANPICLCGPGVSDESIDKGECDMCGGWL